MTVFLFCVVAAVFGAVGVANQYDRKHGKLSPPRRFDVLAQDDPPVAAPFPGEPTGS